MAGQSHLDPAAVVARHMNSYPAADQERVLRELLAHTAAGLVVITGDRAAAETVYKLADAIVSRVA